MDAFFDSDHNFVILSNAGKPIYSLNGDIYNLSSVYATLYAMISKVQNYKFKPIDVSIREEKYDDFDERRGPGTFGQSFHNKVIEHKEEDSPSVKNSFENGKYQSSNYSQQI